MKFSIRELGILTAYTALLVSNDPNVLALVAVIVVAVAAFMLLTFAVARRTDSAGVRKRGFPALFMIPLRGAVSSHHGLSTSRAAGGMFVTMVSASVPIFLLLGARQQELTYHVVRIGRASLAAAAIAGYAAILIGLYFAWPIFSDPFQAIHFRTSAIVGEIAAALTIWIMEPKARIEADSSSF